MYIRRVERGATILEILAVIFISSFILGGAYVAFAQITGLGQDSTSQTNDDQTTVSVLNTLTSELSRAAQIIYFEHPDYTEWRYKKDEEYRTLVLQTVDVTKGTKSLTHFHFPNDATKFADKTYSYINDTSIYKKTFLDKTISFEIKKRNASGANVTMPDNVLFKDRETFRFSLSHRRTMIASDGSPDDEILYNEAVFTLFPDKENITTTSFPDAVSVLVPTLANSYLHLVGLPLASITKAPIGNTTVDVSLKNIRVGETELPYWLWYSVRQIAEKRSSRYTFSNPGTEGNLGIGGEKPGVVFGQPVTNIAWRDAIVWLNAWSEIHSLNPVYRDKSGNVLRNASTVQQDDVVQSIENGYRLPTNIEWEVTARWIGLTNPVQGDLATERIETSEGGTPYYWMPASYASGATSSTDSNAVSWTAKNATKTQLSKSLRMNKTGLFDVSGNVAEFSFSQHPTSVNYREIRGGSYDTNKYAISETDYVQFNAKQTAVGIRPYKTDVPNTLVNTIAIASPVYGDDAVLFIETEQYTSLVSWASALKNGKTFDPNTSYTATFQLVLKNGYSASTLPNHYFSVAGATTMTHTQDILKFSAKFPKTAPAPNTIDLGFVPSAGVTPPDSVDITDPNTGATIYTAAVQWNPALPKISKKFAPETTYTATITLNPVAGYTPYISANSLRVKDAVAVWHGEKQDYSTDTRLFVGAMFPETEKTIENGTISIAPPKTDAKPTTKITSTKAFTGTIAWKGDFTADGKFDAEKTYEATITIAPTKGFTLIDTTDNFFTVPAAKTSAYTAESSTVTATFAPTTARNTVKLAPKSTKIELLLVKPRAFFTPQGKITNLDGWTSSAITWKTGANEMPKKSDSSEYEPFKGDTVYTAEFTVDLPNFFDISKLTPNSFEIKNASSVTYDIATKKVVAMFPKTLNLSIDIPVVSTVPTNITPVSNSVPLNATVDKVFLAGLSSAYATVPASKVTMFPLGMNDALVPVTLPDFKIGKTEVSYRLWYDVRNWAESEGYVFEYTGQEGSTSNVSSPTDAQFEPVTFVSWRDMIVWLNAMSESENFPAVYRDLAGNILKDATDVAAMSQVVANENNKGYRLPTDVEWEMAARWIGTSPPAGGGALMTARIVTTEQDPTNKSAPPVRYYWTPGQYASGAKESTTVSAATQAVAWYDVLKNAAIGQLTPNLLGIYDMSGNMWERTWEKSLRGGSFKTDVSTVRLSALRIGDRGGADEHVSFRIAQTL
jgi:formylglycine-generating enzyme required for sulfatase activity